MEQGWAGCLIGEEGRLIFWRGREGACGRCGSGPPLMDGWMDVVLMGGREGFCVVEGGWAWMGERGLGRVVRVFTVIT